jgi:hypothetical protein
MASCNRGRNEAARPGGDEAAESFLNGGQGRAATLFACAAGALNAGNLKRAIPSPDAVFGDGFFAARKIPPELLFFGGHARSERNLRQAAPLRNPGFNSGNPWLKKTLD